MATNFIERDGFLGFKNSKDEKCGDSKLFENQNLRKYLQNVIWSNYFSKSKMRRQEMICSPKMIIPDPSEYAFGDSDLRS